MLSSDRQVLVEDPARDYCSIIVMIKGKVLTPKWNNEFLFAAYNSD